MRLPYNEQFLLISACCFALERKRIMSLPQNEQDIIIDACCMADDHCAGPHVYARKYIEQEGIEYTDEHEAFVDWYLSTWDGKD